MNLIVPSEFKIKKKVEYQWQETIRDFQIFSAHRIKDDGSLSSVLWYEVRGDVSAPKHPFSRIADAKGFIEKLIEKIINGQQPTPDSRNDKPEE